MAGAAPQPTVTQVQQKLTQLTDQAQRLEQEYAGAQQQLSAANLQLTAINTEVARDESSFSLWQGKMAEIATAAYENGDFTSPEAMLTGNAQEILNESSILAELSSSDKSQVKAYLAAARQLENAQQSAQRVRDGRLALKDKLASEKAENSKVTAQQENLLAQLTPAQQATVTPGTGGSTVAQDPLPDTSQALKAVQFAYDQLNCPYVYGGTGPCADGFDCSGLTQAAWAYAGVAIERTSEDQWDSLPHVSEADMQPGDIMVFNGAGHVGIYVGHGELIDAPHTGADVELVPFQGWYQETFDGAVRP